MQLYNLLLQFILIYGYLFLGWQDYLLVPLILLQIVVMLSLIFVRILINANLTEEIIRVFVDKKLIQTIGYFCFFVPVLICMLFILNLPSLGVHIFFLPGDLDILEFYKSKLGNQTSFSLFLSALQLFVWQSSAYTRIFSKRLKTTHALRNSILESYVLFPSVVNMCVGVSAIFISYLRNTNYGNLGLAFAVVQLFYLIFLPLLEKKYPKSNYHLFTSAFVVATIFGSIAFLLYIFGLGTQTPR